MNVMSGQEAVETAQGRQKDHAISRFYNHAVIDHVATEKNEGKTTYKDVVYVEIMQPGMRRQSFNGKATDQHIARFKPVYDRFIEGDKEEVINGFPIMQWPGVTPAEQKNLKVLGFLSVESVADAPDAALKGMGMRDISNRAKNFIQALNGPEAMNNRMTSMEAKMDALKFQNDEKDDTIKTLKAEVKTLKKKVKEDA